MEAVYAGRSSGNEVTLAVVTDGDKAAGYVCNGRNVEAWLQGSVHGNQVSMTGLHGAGLTGSLSGLAMFGTVTPGAGLSVPFSAELSPEPAGVYQARITVDGLATRIGWAVLPDGTQMGVAVAGTTKYAAPPLDLSNDSFTLGGASFTASDVDGDQTVVSPVNGRARTRCGTTARRAKGTPRDDELSQWPSPRPATNGPSRSWWPCSAAAPSPWRWGCTPGCTTRPVTPSTSRASPRRCTPSPG